MTDIFPAIDIYNRLTEKNSLIPIFTSIPVMRETPLNIFEKLYKNCSNTFILHSGKSISNNSRYSFLGALNEPIIKGNGRINSLEQLQSLLDDYSSTEIDYIPHFWGGAIGYFGYSLASCFERIPQIAIDDLHIPEFCIGFTDELIAFDHEENILKVIICLKKDENYTDGIERINKLVSEIRSQKTEAESQRPTVRNLKSNMTKRQFISMVKRAKEYIEAGDIFQANLSQRFEGDFDGDPWKFYKKLYNINPSPFGGYINFKNLCIISASPERLIKITPSAGLIETRPIAGTRPRGKERLEDIELSKELLLNEKERAEHIMLVDLERNDLGRVCKYGTVNVAELMTLESYSHVWHIVSKVVGSLRDDVRFIDILRACFPGGTITGCPKVRCMEIIEELEPVKRGVYTGSIGYIGYDGKVDLNIIIRSALIKNGRIYFHAGAGIVADSEPEMEYKETLLKAKAILEALRLK